MYRVGLERHMTHEHLLFLFTVNAGACTSGSSPIVSHTMSLLPKAPNSKHWTDGGLETGHGILPVVA